MRPATPLVRASALALALAAFSFAGPSNDPIVGTWDAHVTTINSDTESPTTLAQYDAAIIYSTNHQTNWNSDLTGAWKAKGSTYGFDLSDSVEQDQEAATPGVKAKAKCKMSKIQVVLPAQYGHVNLHLTLKLNGQKAVVDQVGGFGATIE